MTSAEIFDRPELCSTLGRKLDNQQRTLAEDRAEERIRVAFVMHVMQVAGAEVLVKQIIERLHDRIEPVVFCLDDVGELGHQLLDEGVPVVAFDRRPGLDMDVARRLAKETTARGIQVIHAHQYTPFFYSALARLRFRAQSKILFTEHGRHYPDVVSWKRRCINRIVLQRMADATTACCDFSTKALREIEGFPHAKTLANGVDLTRLPQRGEPADQQALRERLGLDHDRPYAACVARFHHVKDHQTLLRGWKHVVAALPSAKLLLVGDGPERTACEAFCGELDLGDSVEFWGIRQDVPDILRAVDVFTLTSVSEAASLTLLEAMASEAPSVLTEVGGNGEHVRNGREGFLVPRGDAEAVAKRLVQLLSDRQFGRSMGFAARERVVAKFSLSETIDAYERLYRQLAS